MSAIGRTEHLVRVPRNLEPFAAILAVGVFPDIPRRGAELLKCNLPPGHSRTNFPSYAWMQTSIEDILERDVHSSFSCIKSPLNMTPYMRPASIIVRLAIGRFVRLL